MYESYYDSAEGAQISRKRLLQELKVHGCPDSLEFDADFNVTESYDAKKVLNWLGY
jgi:hypothetical protein